MDEYRGIMVRRPFVRGHGGDAGGVEEERYGLISREIFGFFVVVCCWLIHLPTSSPFLGSLA